MSQKTTFSLHALTNNDDNYWRVDWFGYVNYSSSKTGSRRTEPMVYVYLSRVIEYSWDKTFLSRADTDLKNSRAVAVPIEALTLLRLGDIWHRGKLVKTPKYHHETFDFHSDNAKTITAGEKFDKEAYWISARSHPYHLHATKAFCERIHVGLNDYLIVPHYVLLQAYFSRCSYVFRQLFQFGLLHEQIYNKEDSYFGDGDPAVITLKTRVKDSAANEVARIAWDNHTYIAASMVSQSLAAQAANNQQKRPKTSFPFSNQTALTVRGKWCDINKSARSFIVFDIEKCTATFPFTSLEFFRDNPGDSNPQSRPLQGNEPKYKTPSKPRPKPPKDITLNPDEEPLNQLGELFSTSRSQIQYDDLNDKSVDKIRQKPHKDQQSSKPDSKDFSSVEEAGMGDGDVQGTGAPLSTSADTEDDTSTGDYIFDHKVCRLRLFKNFSDELSDRDGIESIRYISKEDNGHCLLFPETLTDTLRVRKWSYVDYIKGLTIGEPTQLRRCLVCEIKYDGQYCYVFEAERRLKEVETGWIELDRPSLLIVRSYKQLYPSHIDQVLIQCAENSGIWQNEIFFDAEFNSEHHPANESINNGTYNEKLNNIVFKRTLDNE